MFQCSGMVQFTPRSVPFSQKRSSFAPAGLEGNAASPAARQSKNPTLATLTTADRWRQCCEPRSTPFQLSRASVVIALITCRCVQSMGREAMLRAPQHASARQSAIRITTMQQWKLNNTKSHNPADATRQSPRCCNAYRSPHEEYSTQWRSSKQQRHGKHEPTYVTTAPRKESEAVLFFRRTGFLGRGYP